MIWWFRECYMKLYLWSLDSRALSFFQKMVVVWTMAAAAGGAVRVWERERMMERVWHNGREISIHKSNKVMTFRVIKFCKHSPSGLTVISNLLSSSFPFFLFPFPIPSSHLTHSLTFSSCSSSIEHLSTPDIFVYTIFVFDFHFSFFFCPHCPLLSFVLLALSYFLAGLIVFFSH